MADDANPTSARGINTRQPCLDFIETRLPEYHEAFANKEVRFNAALGRYAPVQQATPQVNMGDRPEDEQLQVLPEQGPPLSGSGPERRPFWDVMFSRAMAQLMGVRGEPTGLIGTPYSIRAAPGWPEIVNTLEAARAKYYNYAGFVGFWKKARHRMADHADGGKALLSLLPDSDYTSVIHCVFDAIFDACPLFRLVPSVLSHLTGYVLCRRPKGLPRSETKSRKACASCARSSKTSKTSWPCTKTTRMLLLLP
jgi:hypothetical protein